MRTKWRVELQIFLGIRRMSRGFATLRSPPNFWVELTRQRYFLKFEQNWANIARTRNKSNFVSSGKNWITLLAILECRPLDWKVPLVIIRLDSRSLPRLVTVAGGASRSVSALWWIVSSVDWTPGLFVVSLGAPPSAHNTLWICSYLKKKWFQTYPTFYKTVFKSKYVNAITSNKLATLETTVAQNFSVLVTDLPVLSVDLLISILSVNLLT